MIKSAVNSVLAVAGLELKRKKNPDFSLADQPEWIRDIVRAVAPFTMTSAERLASLCQSVSYVVKHNIAGDIVECGVWRGGSMMAAALALKHCGDTTRRLFLFDTFEGMSEPTPVDIEAQTNKAASTLLSRAAKSEEIWCYSPLEEVRNNLASTRYPTDQIIFIKGKVEDTIPSMSPSPIAVLRLDTDWYESTKHELAHLYPAISRQGVLIIDDYGHWDGARKAVDEYIEGHRVPLLLNRIDYTGRIAVKP